MVEIEGTEQGEMVIYRISDNGIGIPEENKHKMFKIFNRMDNAKNSKEMESGYQLSTEL